MKIKLIVVLNLLLICVGQSGCLFRNIPIINSQIETYEKGKQERQNELISKNPDLQTLAKICEQLGSLQNFKLLSREMSSHSRPALYYYYDSNISYTDTFKTFSAFLEQDGWHSTENVSINSTFSYQKDDWRVIVQYGGMRDAEYGLTCEKASEGSR